VLTSILCVAGLATGSLLALRLGRGRLSVKTARLGNDEPLQRFLDENSGPLELRVFREQRTLRLQNPTAEQVLALIGDSEAELWRLEGPEPIAFVHIAARGRSAD
jgi:hypothetical protein